MNSNKIACIYRIKNTANGKFYIGSTMNWYKRKHDHLYDLRKNKHYNAYLQRAWDKYGEASFVFEIFEQLDGIDNQTLRDIEEWWIKNTNCYQPDGYNLSKSGVGYEWSIAHRRAMSKTIIALNRTHPIDVRNKISESNRKHYSNPVNRKKQKYRATKVKLSVKHTFPKQKHIVYKMPPKKHSKELIEKIRLGKIEHDRPVEQWANGIMIKVHKSAAHAKLETGLHGILRAAKGVLKQSGGFQWRFQDPNNIEPLYKKDRLTTAKPIEQWKDGTLIARYKSARDAAAKTGITKCSRAARGAGSIAGGYEWKYSDSKKESKTNDR